MNCFVQGHVAKQCRSKPMCTKCSGPHHSILHVERKKSSFTQSKTPAAVTQPAPDKSTCTHTLKDTPSNVLLMTCQLNVMGPKGSMKKARALIDPGSSTSFISERLVKRLRLPRRDSSVKISGIAGISKESSRGTTRFHVTRFARKGATLAVEATVLPKIIAKLPSRHIAPSRRWRHLENIGLADPKYGTPAKIELILGADLSDKIMRHGRRTGPSGSPTALKTIFGWVLIGPVKKIESANRASTGHITMTSEDERSKKPGKSTDTETVLSAKQGTVKRRHDSPQPRDGHGGLTSCLPNREDRSLVEESRARAGSLERPSKKIRTKNSRKRIKKVLAQISSTRTILWKNRAS